MKGGDAMDYEVIKSVVVILAFLVAGLLFLWRAYRLLWVNLRPARPSGPFRDWGERVHGLIVFVGGQLRLFRVLVPGTSHFFIFWGFLFLFPTILQAILEGLLAFAVPNFVLPLVGEFGPLALIQDLLTVCVAIAVLYGLYLRQVVNPARYQGSHKQQGIMVLLFIFTIMVSLLVMNGIRINLGDDALGGWRPISALVGRLFAGLGEGTQHVMAEIAYFIHLGVVLAFLTELPGGKHFHVVTSIPAVLLRDLQPRGRLAPAAELEDGAGVGAIHQFTWRQLLDAYTCTECGRCQDVCPAHAAGQPLSPKLLMMALRDHLVEVDGRARNGAPGQRLIGDAVDTEALWSCLTCYACDQECPLFIEHVLPIVDMRRHLVNQGAMDSLLQETLGKLARYGNSFGQSERNRARWTQGLETPVKDARKEAVEYLWFVGDYASYSAASADITRVTAEVFQRIGLDFGILYDGERNAGNDVRRVGEEGLFEMLSGRNAAALGRCGFKAIVTTDPHSYNTLKNEYPAEAIGGRPVLHYTELLNEMLLSGALRFGRQLGKVVTYSDPCYLGRYNAVYDAPRRLILATGCRLMEMPRCGDRAACCGAGGGRIWMEEKEVKERPSEMRVREAAALDGVQVMAVACPKDVTMYNDAAKTTGMENRLAVKEVIELVHAAL